MDQKVYKKYFILLLGVSILVRILIALTTELGNDEVYYRLYAQPLNWNYFDHPLAVGWLIRLTTFNLISDTDFLIRMGALISGTITLIIIFNCGKILKDERAGFYSAAIFSSTIYGTVISGTFILPDSPQMVFWSLSLYLLIKISKKTISSSKLNYYLILFGVCVGLGMLCKVHSIFLWLGFGLFVLLKRRDLLFQYGLYFSVLITFIFLIPIIKWNIDNHFITYNYHSNRVSYLNGGVNLSSFLTFNLGQVFYTNIILFPIFISSIISFFRKTKEEYQDTLLLILFISLPLILVSTFLSLFNTVLPHWTGPSFAGISLFTGVYFSNKSTLVKVPKIIIYGLSLTLIVCIAGVFVINFYPGTLGSKENKNKGFGDFTLDMSGWKNAKEKISDILEKDVKNNLMKADAPFIENKWFPAAHIEHYIANPLKRRVLAIGSINDIHQYYFLNKTRKGLGFGDNAYCLVPSNYLFDANQAFGHLFTNFDTAAIISSIRNNNIARKFYLLRFKGYHNSQNAFSNFRYSY